MLFCVFKQSRPLNIPESGKHIFRDELRPGLPPVGTISRCIELEEKVKAPPRTLYQLSPAELPTAQEYIEENLRLRKVRPGKSPSGSPVLICERKEWKNMRSCGLLGFESKKRSNSTATSRSNEMFDFLRKARLFSNMDLEKVPSNQNSLRSCTKNWF